MDIVTHLQQAVKTLTYLVRIETGKSAEPYLKQALVKAQSDLAAAQGK